MTASIPVASDAPAGSRPRGRAPGQLAVTITAVAGLVGLLVVVAGIVMATRPVHTPTQDCGTAAGFLIHGRLNEYHDPAAPPKGTTTAEVEDNNATPCQERAANQARPGGVLIAAGTAVTLLTLFVEMGVRIGLRRRLRRP